MTVRGVDMVKRRRTTTLSVSVVDRDQGVDVINAIQFIAESQPLGGKISNETTL